MGPGIDELKTSASNFGVGARYLGRATKGLELHRRGTRIDLIGLGSGTDARARELSTLV